MSEDRKEAPKTRDDVTSSTVIVEELASAIEFSTNGWLRRLRDEVHRRFQSNWHEESELCAATVIRASTDVESSIVVREFLHTGNDDFWVNLMMFARVVDVVDFDAVDIAQMEGSLPATIYNDMTIGQYLIAIKRWAVRFPARAEALLDSMITPDGAAIRRLHVVVLEALGEATHHGQYSRESLDHRIDACIVGSDDLLAGVALAYPSLIASGVVNEAEYRERLRVWISSEASEQVAGAAVRSLVSILSREDTGDGYRDFLLSAASDERPAVRLALVWALRPLTESTRDEARRILEEIVPVFVSTPTKHGGVIHDLSWMLLALVEKHPELVMAFLRSWAERTDDDLPIWHSKRFLHVINQLPADTLVGGAVAWILSSPKLEDTGLRLILDERRLRSLPASTVAGLTPSEVQICAFVFAAHDHRVDVAYLLASLVKEAVGRKDCKHLVSLFEELLIHVLANYPSTAPRLLSIIQDAKSTAGRALIKRLRQVVSGRADNLKQVYGLPEFVPSEDRQRVYERFERDFRRLVHRTDLDDPGRHPLLSMFRQNEVQLLGGGSILSTDPESFGAAQALAELSVESELPRLQVLDPQSEQIRRLNLRIRIEELRQLEGDRSATPAP